MLPVLLFAKLKRLHCLPVENTWLSSGSFHSGSATVRLCFTPPWFNFAISLRCTWAVLWGQLICTMGQQRSVPPLILLEAEQRVKRGREHSIDFTTFRRNTPKIGCFQSLGLKNFIIDWMIRAASLCGVVGVVQIPTDDEMQLNYSKHQQ